MNETLNARVELFKTVATFGFLAAAMFCVGGPLTLKFVYNEGLCRDILTVVCGGAGFLIVLCILMFYCKLSRKISEPAYQNKRPGVSP